MSWEKMHNENHYSVTIDPVSRIEGHLKIKVEISDGIVVDAWSTGSLWRGMEEIFKSRDPRDAVQFTQRICGVCPTSHAVASAAAVEDALGVEIPEGATLVRNLLQGAEELMSHLAALYLLEGPDYASQIPELEPFRGKYYLQAAKIKVLSHEMAAVLGGRAPHPGSVIIGGTSFFPEFGKVKRLQSMLREIKEWVDSRVLADVERIGKEFPEYRDIGGGTKNFMSFGAYPQAGRQPYHAQGIFSGGKTQPLDAAKISESVEHSWFSADSVDGKNEPAVDKKDAYSWMKAPRYGGEVFELGPLARAIVSGRRKARVSVLDRLEARAEETVALCREMEKWLVQAEDPLPNWNKDAWNIPREERRGFGFTEAPRGGLGHWVWLSDAKIAKYSAIPPTTWNASPRDGDGQKGAIEQVLLGTPVKSAEHPVEVLRVVRSFDPCLACACHVIDLDGKKQFDVRVL